jgi:hypothetical protein
MKLPPINGFVEWELRKFRDECNFSDEELMYFNLRAKNNSNVQIAMQMNVSEAKVSKLARRVKDKMLKVI